MSELDKLPISNPARRALATAGIESLEDLTRKSEAELLRLHGMGPKAFGVLSESMKSNGLCFASDADIDRISATADQELQKHEKNY